jgi:hypothetical protein
MSPAEAFRTAIERAKIEALAAEFGTLITQADGSIVENKSGIFLSKSERRAAILGAFAHYLPILLFTILSFGLVMLLILLWLS